MNYNNNNNTEMTHSGDMSRSTAMNSDSMNENRSSYNVENTTNESESNNISAFFSNAINYLKDLPIFSNRSRNLESRPINVLKHVLHTVDSQIVEDEDLKTNHHQIIERIYFDLHVYASILQTSITIILVFIVFLGYHTIYHRCELGDHEVKKWVVEIRKCNLTPTITSFMKISLLLSNLFTLFLICYDKYQAINHGYRIYEFLIILCIFAGGVPTAWFLLFALSHKTKRFYFIVNSIFATLFSSFWFYIYHLFDL